MRGKDTYTLVVLNFVSCRSQVLGLQQRPRRKHYKTLLSEMSATTATLFVDTYHQVRATQS